MLKEKILLPETNKVQKPINKKQKTNNKDAPVSEFYKVKVED
jgi:hypothetical protein